MIAFVSESTRLVYIFICANLFYNPAFHGEVSLQKQLYKENFKAVEPLVTAKTSQIWTHECSHKHQSDYYIELIASWLNKRYTRETIQWTVPQLSIMITYNCTWSILIQ